MICKKCNKEIEEGMKYCPNCGNDINNSNNKKRTIIIFIIIIIICFLSVLLMIIFKNNKNDTTVNNNDINSIKNQNEETADKSDTELDDVVSKAYQEASNEEYENDYPDFQRTESWYNNPDNSGIGVTMPDLTGMDAKNLNDYLKNNNLDFLQVVYTFGDTSYNAKIPTKIISTIPSAGTIINNSADSKITVLAECVYKVDGVELKIGNEDIYSNYFGKKIKIQIENDSDNFIEGTIGSDFTRTSRSAARLLKYVASGNTFQLLDDHKMAYIRKEYLKNELKGSNADTVNCKIYLDNQFYKEIICSYNGHLIRGDL